MNLPAANQVKALLLGFAMVYHISYSTDCWSLDRWACFDLNSHNACSGHINNFFLFLFSWHIIRPWAPFTVGHKMILNFLSYLCGPISICAWQACEQTPLTLLELLDMGTDLTGSILNKLLCCQVHFATICNFF